MDLVEESGDVFFDVGAGVVRGDGGAGFVEEVTGSAEDEPEVVKVGSAG